MKTILVMTALVVAISNPSHARAAAAQSCQSPSSMVTSLLSEHGGGLRPYVTGIGSTGWTGKSVFAQAITASGAFVGPFCGSTATAAAGSKAEASERRFASLLAAFPTAPTAKQWKARIRPLMQAGAATDTALLTVIQSAAQDAVAASCGGTTCQNGDLPTSLSDVLGAPGCGCNEQPMILALTADQQWLAQAERLPLPAAQ